MAIELESWEERFETEHHEGRGRGGRGRSRDRPTRGRGSPWRPRPTPLDDLDGTWSRVLWPQLATPDSRAYRLLERLCRERTDLLGWARVRRYQPGLIALSGHRRDWVRPADDWVPPGGGDERQFRDLVRHLLARYDTPSFLASAWLEGLTPDGVAHQAWYKLVASGRSIRAAKGLPLPLTKRMAHHFLRAPDDLDVSSALRRAQVLALGGDERLARSLLGTRLRADFRENDFWGSVIRWFVGHPSVDPAHHGPIVDYLHDQRFVPSAANPESRRRGRPRQSLFIPPQPNLAMRGRTPEALLRDVERWHLDLGRSRPATVDEWPSSGITPLVCAVGDGALRRVFETTELICPAELQDEGEALRHCVATYWKLCQSGQASIWSLTAEDASGHVERLLTLEVRCGGRAIVQASGMENRMPTAEELRILGLWADSGGPALSKALTD